MEEKISYGVYHEHVMDLYEFKHPEKLLSYLTDSPESDSESSNDEKIFDDSDTELNDSESETVDENNNLNRFMSHLDAIFNETKNLNRSMSHVNAIFNDHSNICNLDEISVPILNHRKIPLDDNRTIRPFLK